MIYIKLNIGSTKLGPSQDVSKQQANNILYNNHYHNEKHLPFKFVSLDYMSIYYEMFIPVHRFVFSFIEVA